MIIEQDLQADPREVAIDRESMRRWEPPHDGDRVAEADRDRIIANMRRALADRGYELTFLDLTSWPTLPPEPRPVTREAAEQFAIATFRHLAPPNSTITELTSSCEAAVGEPDGQNASEAIWRVRVNATLIEPSPGRTRDSHFMIEVNQATGVPTVTENLTPAPPHRVTLRDAE